MLPGSPGLVVRVEHDEGLVRCRGAGERNEPAPREVVRGRQARLARTDHDDVDSYGLHTRTQHRSGRPDSAQAPASHDTAVYSSPTGRLAAKRMQSSWPHEARRPRRPRRSSRSSRCMTLGPGRMQCSRCPRRVRRPRPVRRPRRRPHPRSRNSSTSAAAAACTSSARAPARRPCCSSRAPAARPTSGTLCCPTPTPTRFRASTPSPRRLGSAPTTAPARPSHRVSRRRRQRSRSRSRHCRAPRTCTR